MKQTAKNRRCRRSRRLGVAFVAGIALTAGLATGTAHAAFPGGNGKIYFIQSQNVFSMNPDGSALTQLTTVGHISIARVNATGTKVAFLEFSFTTDTDQVYTMNPDGSGITQLTSGASATAGFPTATQINCDTGAPLNTSTMTDTAGGSGLSYDSTSNTYTYVWKTLKSWAGTCQQFDLRLTDDTDHLADFTLG